MSTAPLGDTLQRRLKLVMDIGERCFSIILFSGMVMRITHSPAFRPWDALALISEGLVVSFIVFRRGTEAVSTRPLDWLVAFAGTAAPMFVRVGGHALAPPAAVTAIMLAGMLFAIWGKLILRRSFGLAAANRGVVDSGPYAFIRHPIYAGYLILYVGFFLANPLAWNAAVYSATLALLVLRVLAEERVLERDTAYATFMGRVRYRLAPGVF